MKRGHIGQESWPPPIIPSPNYHLCLGCSPSVFFNEANRHGRQRYVASVKLLTDSDEICS